MPWAYRVKRGPRHHQYGPDVSCLPRKTPWLQKSTSRAGKSRPRKKLNHGLLLLASQRSRNAQGHFCVSRAGAVKTRGAKREPWLPQEPWVWTHCVGLIFKGWGSDREVAKRSQWQLSAGPRYHRMMHDVQPGTGTVATVSTAPGTLGTVGNWSDDCWSVMKRMTRWMGAGTLPKLQARKPRRHRWTALPFPQRAIVPGDYTSECKS